MLPRFETLALSQPEEHVLLVTLDRPQVMNAINTQMGRDLRALFTDLPACRAVVLTGAGDRAFCAGGDLKERNGMTDEAWQAQHVIFEEGAVRVIDCLVPVIAAVNGVAYGGGCELALCCDFIYAASTARFALPEVSLGIMPGAGGTQNLPRAIGERRAKELILSARPFSAAEAAEWGMVNRVCEPAELMPAVLETARRIAGNAPLSTIQAKKAMHLGLPMDLHTALRFEIEAYNRLVPTEDRREGVKAFNEKRKPDWRGR